MMPTLLQVFGNSLLFTLSGKLGINKPMLQTWIVVFLQKNFKLLNFVFIDYYVCFVNGNDPVIHYSKVKHSFAVFERDIKTSLVFT